MHELSYCEGVLDLVLERAHGRRVLGVGVQVGVVHRVVADAFAQGFEVAAAGTPAEGARTELVVGPVHGACQECGARFTADDPAPACPGCGSFDVRASGGDEVVLTWISYEDTSDDMPVVVPAHEHPEVC